MSVLDSLFSEFGYGKGNRGIDAPESQMPFGKEAQQELLKIVQWKSLKVLVYGEDQYGRCVADLYCNGIFVQVTKVLIYLFPSAMIKPCKNWLSVSYVGSNAKERSCLALRSL